MTSANSSFGTDNGDVRVQFDVAPTSVVAASDNGSISVVVPQPDSYQVKSSTDNGSTNIDVTDDPASERLIDVATDNGSITVRYGN